MKQQYNNHTKYYPAHHFVFYPLVFVGLVFSIREAFRHSEDPTDWIIISCLWIVVTWVSFMMRQHYGLGNQNRIVRMEMRFRYYVLTQQRMELLEDKLDFRQIAALRFASDEELPGLIKRAIAENLSPNDIKKSVKNWVADEMRV